MKEDWDSEERDLGERMGNEWDVYTSDSEACALRLQEAEFCVIRHLVKVQDRSDTYFLPQPARPRK